MAEPEIIFYDGSCGLCSRLMLRWTPTLRRYGFGIAPLQDYGAGPGTGLSQSEWTHDIRLLRADGEMVSGSEVYRQIMRRIWWAYPIYLLSRLPGLRRIFDSVYRGIARHRHTISQSCSLPAKPEQAGMPDSDSETVHG